MCIELGRKDEEEVADHLRFGSVAKINNSGEVWYTKKSFDISFCRNKVWFESLISCFFIFFLEGCQKDDEGN